jgi:hypothetical protein
MLFATKTVLSALLLSSNVFGATLKGLRVRDKGDDSNPEINIFPKDDDSYNKYAICKGNITKGKFPALQAPSNDGGCVRYYRGIDITGVVTQVNLFFSDGIESACDCATRCLEAPESCTNWVFKYTFMPGDGGKRSCTLYSSPNLPVDVTLAYNTAQSKGFQELLPSNNPQTGCDAPLTFLDADNTQPDNYGVSGFMVRDSQGRQYC